jgi:hypothetical protein
MKSITLWKTSTLVLAGVLAFCAGNAVYEAQAEPQPHMKAALANLQTAANQLEKASHDKGGHRAAALKLTKEAMAQVQAGIDADNKNKKSVEPEMEATAVE